MKILILAIHLYFNSYHPGTADDYIANIGHAINEAVCEQYMLDLENDAADPGNYPPSCVAHCNAQLEWFTLEEVNDDTWICVDILGEN